MDGNLKYNNLQTSQLSPVVGMCRLITEDIKNSDLKNYEQASQGYYEVEFIIEGSGSILINDQEYKVNANNIIFKKPTQTCHRICTYKSYLVRFAIAAPCRHDMYSARRRVVIYTNSLVDQIPTLTCTNYADKYIPLFNSLLNEFSNPTAASDLFMKICILQIISTLYMETLNALNENAIPLTCYHTKVKKALDYINKNIHNKITLDQLSAYVNVSKNHLLKIFSDTVGMTPNEYITKKRLDMAKEMLMMTDSSITQIATSCGFDNTTYFSYLFKKHTNLSPRSYRKLHGFI